MFTWSKHFCRIRCSQGQQKLERAADSPQGKHCCWKGTPVRSCEDEHAGDGVGEGVQRGPGGWKRAGLSPHAGVRRGRLQHQDNVAGDQTGRRGSRRRATAHGGPGVPTPYGVQPPTALSPGWGGSCCCFPRPPRRALHPHQCTLDLLRERWLCLAGGEAGVSEACTASPGNPSVLV